MRTNSSLAWAVPLLVAALSASPVVGKRGLFSGLTRLLSGEQTAPSASGDRSLGLDTLVGNVLASPDEEDKLGDAFEEDADLNSILRLLDGDDFSVVQEAWKSKGMEQLFTDPQGLRTMLTTMPMLKAFKGVEDIAAKDTLTPEDGKAVLGTLQAFMGKFPEKMAQMADSESIAKVFKHYSELDDPKFKDLMAKAKGGSWKASTGLHKHLIDLEWDGLIDAEKFGGLDGKETSTMKMQRELFQQLEPDLFKFFMHKDPMVKKYVTNPAAAYEEAKIFAQYNPELDVM